ncbi:MAG: hypothetical protein VB106_09045, partial [Clostridiaceae bacterium]|nr:hypothetical protein [Clostridiaceae bacterium]
SALHIWRCILEDGIRKKEIRELDLDFVSELFMNLPDILKNMDFPSDKDQMLRFYGNFMDFLKYGFLGGMEEGVYDGEKRTDES